jgi:hypothetical protein
MDHGEKSTNIVRVKDIILTNPNPDYVSHLSPVPEIP